MPRSPRRALAPALVALACAAVPAAAQAADPELVRDPDGVPVVAGHDVADHGADATGATDASAAIQAALDAAGAEGGGVVWIGAGRYRVGTPLTVPRGVTLLGEWDDPADGRGGHGGHGHDHRHGGHGHGGRDRETVILAQPDPAAQTPFLTLVGGGGIQGMSVYYPQQRADAPVAYPPTVRLGGNGSQFASVKQVTLVNPWEAVRAGTDNNELGVLNEVRMSPLSRGITIDFATDVGRIEDVSISPRWWAGFDGSSERAIAAHARANVIGLDIGRSDTQYVKDLEVTDAAAGLRLRTDRGVVNDVTTASSGQYADLDLRRVGTGVVLDDVNTIAVQLTHARIEAQETGIAVGAGFRDTTFNCQDCEIEAPDGTPVRLAPGADGTLGLYASRLRAGHGPAAVVEGGALQLQRTQVQRRGRGAAIELRPGAGALDLVDTNVRAKDVANGAPGADVVIEDGPQPRLRPAPDAPRLPEQPRPRGDALVDATDAPYGADPTAATDATAAIQRALDATARRGGGIAYLPAGRYRLDGALSVPSGVELRGAQITPFHSNAAATVLYVNGGAGNPDGPAAITLRERAGVSGLMTWYPGQSADAPVAHPYAVRVAGRDAWVRHFDVGNAWRGIDAASASDTSRHQLDWVVGAPLDVGIALGNARDGVVRRTHFNPHFWFRTTGTTLPGAPVDWDAMMALFFKIMKIQDTTLDAFVLGSARDQVIDQAFVYRTKVGGRFVRQDGRGFEGLLYGFWVDAAVDSWVVEATGPRGFDCVNCDAGAIPWGFDASRPEIPTPDPATFSESYIRIEPGAGRDSEARFHNFGGNAFNWNPFRGVVVRDGRLQLAQAAFSANPRDDGGALQLLGGETDAAALSFNRVGRIAPDNVSFLRQPVWTDVFVAPGVREARIGGMVARDGSKLDVRSRSRGVRVSEAAVLGAAR